MTDKKYTFDPTNKLTRGLPVPERYRPLGPDEEDAAGDIMWCVMDEIDVDGFVGDLADGPDAFAGNQLKEGRIDGFVFFRKLDPNPELIAKIPAGYQMYNKPGEPPESVEDWMFVSLNGTAVARSVGSYDAEDSPTNLAYWIDWPGEFLTLKNYARTWCLARPVAKSEVVIRAPKLFRSCRECSFKYKAPYTTPLCAKCSAAQRADGEPVDQRTHDLRDDMLASIDPGERDRSFVVTYGGAKGGGMSDALIVDALYGGMAGGGKTAALFAAVTGIDLETMGPVQPHGFEIVEHTSRDERDAALIEQGAPHVGGAGADLHFSFPSLPDNGVAARQEQLDRMNKRDASWTPGALCESRDKRGAVTVDIGADWED